MKDGMAMTGHKTVEMFLRYVHPDEKRLRKSVEKVSTQRRKLVNRRRLVEENVVGTSLVVPQLGKTRTTQGNYRPYRRRKGANREAPEHARSAEPEESAA